MRREVIVRDTSSRAVRPDLVYRMPGLVVRRHQDKAVEHTWYLDRMPYTFIPKFQVPAVFGLPIRCYVVKQIQNAIVPLLAVMRIINMRLKKMPAFHSTDAAGVKVRIANGILDLSQLRDLVDHSFVLESESNVGDERIELVK